jgi:diguanylate cyclase (GGDEF)-like protein
MSLPSGEGNLRHWPLWTLRRPALLYWLAVDAWAAIALILVVCTTAPPSPDQVVRFAAIATAAGVVIVGTVISIHVRRDGQRNPWAVHVCYLLAGVFALPTNLLVLLLLVPALHGVMAMRPEPHRWLFTTAATTLATFAGRLAAGWEQPKWDAVTLILAGGVLLLVRAVLVAVGLRLRTPSAALDEVLGQPLDVALGLVAVSLGGLLAVASVGEPARVLLAGPSMVLLERAAQLPQWRRSAQRDSKTGLSNAMHWERMAREELVRARSRQLPTAVLLLDLDHFKRVNDQVGHLAGDAALAAVALMLRSSVRRGDLVGRFGGEEFVMLLPEAQPDVAEEVAQRVRQSIEGLRVPTTAADGRQHELAGLTVSIGVATSARFGYELPHLLVAADSALLAAKGSGRNLVTMA